MPSPSHRFAMGPALSRFTGEGKVAAAPFFSLSRAS